MKKEIGIGNGLNVLIYCAVLVILLSVLTGCGAGQKSEAEPEEELVFPGIEDIVSADEEINDEPGADSPSLVVPVKIYVDNTGSMTGFTFNEVGESKKPSTEFKALMRCIQDMGRMQTAEYYVLDADVQNWVLYEDGLYENFDKPDFYVYWAPSNVQPGPLTKLYMEGGLDENCINVVFTDLAEQNLNNTLLAEQIQNMCRENGCDVDLYAFKFPFHGLTQVPSPDGYGMMEDMVAGELKPYYMIITGPSGYMDRYRQGLQNLLTKAGLAEGMDYYTATSKVSMNKDRISLSDVVFLPFAGYDDIVGEYKAKKKQEKEQEEVAGQGGEDAAEAEESGEKAAQSMECLSKNLIRYENTNLLFVNGSETEVAAFRYEKVEGISKKAGDWRLNFYIPLKDYENPDLNYSYTIDIYKIEQPEETESDQGNEASEGEARKRASGRWVKDEDTSIETACRMEDNTGKNNAEFPKAIYYSFTNKEETARVAQDSLVLIKIWKNETKIYEIPAWLEEFDTGMTDDYFTRTFNLEGFYNVLFSGGNGFVAGQEFHEKSVYAQIPILLMDMDRIG